MATKKQEPGTTWFEILYFNGKKDYYKNTNSRLAAEKWAHREAAELKTLVLSVKEVTKLN